MQAELVGDFGSIHGILLRLDGQGTKSEDAYRQILLVCENQE
jgi:hypothetical protein